MNLASGVVLDHEHKRYKLFHERQKLEYNDLLPFWFNQFFDAYRRNAFCLTL